MTISPMRARAHLASMATPTFLPSYRQALIDLHQSIVSFYMANREIEMTEDIRALLKKMYGDIHQDGDHGFLLHDALLKLEKSEISSYPGIRTVLDQAHRAFEIWLR